jgi:hypothetical protein
MINEEIKDKIQSKEAAKIQKAKDINKRTELEKELNIQRNQKNKKNNKEKKMNQLNYYHEIAKNNAHLLMNNPTIKEIVRITSNESVFDQLKAKEESKDLSKFLDIFPLKRVERINYKGLEIGNIRKDLQKDEEANINKEKGKQLAGNLFEKRKRMGSITFIPVLTVDNLNEHKNYYQHPKKKSVELRGSHLVTSSNESWLKKYKNRNHLNIKDNINNKESPDIKKFQHDNYLDSARTEATKYKKDFDIEKQINEKKVANDDNSINKNLASKWNDFNDNNNDYFPKKTLTQKNNFNFGLNFQILSNKEKQIELPGKLKRQSFASSTNIHLKKSFKLDNNEKKLIRVNSKKDNNNETDQTKALKKQDIIKNKQSNEPQEIRDENNNKKPSRFRVTKNIQ